MSKTVNFIITTIVVIILIASTLAIASAVLSPGSTSVELGKGQMAYVYCHGEPVFLPADNMEGWGTVYCR